MSDFQFLASGFESEIYSFKLQSVTAKGEYILRLLTGAGADDKLKQEATGLELMHKAGYPVPELLLQEADASVLGKPFEIIEKLDGQSLWPTLVTGSPDQTEKLLARFGAMLRQLHELDWRAFTPDSTQIEQKPAVLLDQVIGFYRSLYTKYQLGGFLQVVDWLDAHKHEIEVQPAVVHQDFHANNVLLCSNERMYVIDWTQFAVSDFRIDLCWTLLIMGDLGVPEWGSKIFEAYTGESRMTADGLAYFNVIVIMKLLGSTVIADTYGPKEVGLREDAVHLTEQQLVVYRQLADRLSETTGLMVPELTEALEEIQYRNRSKRSRESMNPGARK